MTRRFRYGRKLGVSVTTACQLAHSCRSGHARRFRCLAFRLLPKFGSRFLHAATTCGSISGKGLMACFRRGVCIIIGRTQSSIMPAPLFAPLATKPAWLQAVVILAQGCQGTGLVVAA